MIRTHQEQNVFREKEAMQVMDHPFVVELRGTLSDANQVYLLLEFVPGGELWSLLYEKKPKECLGPWGGLSLRSTVLLSAMCVSAFDHIHGWGFCYRDLKPENLLIDREGYLKIADFGFAKKLPYKTSGGKVRVREERSDKLRRSVFWMATYAADASVRNVATLYFRHRF